MCTRSGHAAVQLLTIDIAHHTQCHAGQIADFLLGREPGHAAADFLGVLQVLRQLVTNMEVGNGSRRYLEQRIAGDVCIKGLFQVPSVPSGHQHQSCTTKPKN